ncbi:MAG TPA: hypothetical protein VK509_16360 [Polyangiales bacterium]|nr:hypothetical protein [Polyangiales bacterium]
MQLARVLRLAVLSAPGAALGACAMPQPPGELVGAYHIEGALTENQCGEEALPATDPLTFDVQLRRDERSGYWLQGMPPARTGRLSDDGAFSFELQQIYDVPTTTGTPSDEPFLTSDPEAAADPDRFDRQEAASRAACRLTITEKVEGSVLREGGSGVHRSDEDDSPDLVGENAIVVAPVSGGNCARVVRAGGGPFEQLPCRASYELVGQLVDDDE